MDLGQPHDIFGVPDERVVFRGKVKDEPFVPPKREVDRTSVQAAAAAATVAVGGVSDNHGAGNCVCQSCGGPVKALTIHERLAASNLEDEDKALLGRVLFNATHLLHDFLPPKAYARVPLIGALFNGLTVANVLRLPSMAFHQKSIRTALASSYNWRNTEFLHLRATPGVSRPKITAQDVEVRVTAETLAKQLVQKSGNLRPTVYYEGKGEILQLYKDSWEDIRAACAAQGVTAPENPRARATFFHRILKMSSYNFWECKIPRSCPTCDELETAQRRLPDVMHLLAAARADDIEEDIAK